MTPEQKEIMEIIAERYKTMKEALVNGKDFNHEFNVTMRMLNNRWVQSLGAPVPIRTIMEPGHTYAICRLNQPFNGQTVGMTWFAELYPKADPRPEVDVLKRFTIKSD